MTLSGVRLAACLLLLGALGFAIYRRRAVSSALREFFLAPSQPQNLGLLRIVLFAALAWVGLQTNAVWWASQPATLRVMPPGWQWLAGLLPINATVASGARFLVVAFGVCAAVGLGTRITSKVAAIAALYLLGVPSFFGKILHSDHALVMMTLVLAAAPCGDALSLDRLWLRRRGRPEPQMSDAYTLPVRLCWLLLGTIYLFPGIWKVWEAGDLWLSGERLLWELQDEWGQRKGFVPPARIDQHPWLLKLLGTATLIFEVGFFFALFQKQARIVAALSAVAFHVGVRLFLGIRFYEYLPLILLIDFRWPEPAPSAAATATATATSGAPQRTPWPSALIGGALLLGQFFVGFAQIDSWPIAMHPKFSERGGPKQITRNHKFVLEPAAGGRERDLVYLLSKLGGGHGFTRVMLRFDRDVARGAPYRDTGRSIVAMLRENGLELVSGDQIAVYSTSWNTYPIGERTGYQKQLLHRYRVSEDSGLELTP
ncbi:MAG TPA: HTTM domain-containing protein [Polyangiales bacterium]|nr:HTTM domain-containing protein [Polyangiales bacterium]